MATWRSSGGDGGVLFYITIKPARASAMCQVRMQVPWQAAAHCDCGCCLSASALCFYLEAQNTKHKNKHPPISHPHATRERDVGNIKHQHGTWNKAEMEMETGGVACCRVGRWECCTLQFRVRVRMSEGQFTLNSKQQAGNDQDPRWQMHNAQWARAA